MGCNGCMWHNGRSYSCAVGNEVVTKVCLTFVYRWLLLSKKKSQTKNLPINYQSVVLAWLVLAFLSDFYLILFASFFTLRTQDIKFSVP